MLQIRKMWPTFCGLCQGNASVVGKAFAAKEWRGQSEINILHMTSEQEWKDVILRKLLDHFNNLRQFIEYDIFFTYSKLH